MSVYCLSIHHPEEESVPVEHATVSGKTFLEAVAMYLCEKSNGDMEKIAANIYPYWFSTDDMMLSISSLDSKNRLYKKCKGICESGTFFHIDSNEFLSDMDALLDGVT